MFDSIFLLDCTFTYNLKINKLLFFSSEPVRPSRQAKTAAIQSIEVGCSANQPTGCSIYETIPKNHELHVDPRNFCTICEGFFYDVNVIQSDFIECMNCRLWQHVDCAGMAHKNLHGYMCESCDDD